MLQLVEYNNSQDILAHQLVLERETLLVTYLRGDLGMIGSVSLEHEHVPSLGNWTHVDGVQDLVVVGALGAPDIGQLPLQVILQVLHAVESDLKLKWTLVGRGIVENHNVVDLNFRHRLLLTFNGFL